MSMDAQQDLFNAFPKQKLKVSMHQLAPEFCWDSTLPICRLDLLHVRKLLYCQSHSSNSTPSAKSVVDLKELQIHAMIALQNFK